MNHRFLMILFGVFQLMVLDKAEANDTSAGIPIEIPGQQETASAVLFFHSNLNPVSITLSVTDCPSWSGAPRPMYEYHIVEPDQGKLTSAASINNSILNRITVEPVSLWPSLQNIGMLVLHIKKSLEKIDPSRYHCHEPTAKDVFFFTAYVLGAFIHAAEIPVYLEWYSLSELSHLLLHSGMAVLSLAALAKDCQCASRLLNWHVVMLMVNSGSILSAASLYWF